MNLEIGEKIDQMGDSMEAELVHFRRDFHRHPEVGWMEMRTSAIIAKELSALGYQVLIGKEVCREEERMGIPDKEDLQAHRKQIEELSCEGESYEITREMEEGFTGVIGTLFCGKGPTIAFRFDIDALPMQEVLAEEHRPYREGFASIYPGMMHACGHDCHIAIGLGTAKILSELRESLHGTVKLLFQPAEEGTRGAYSMVKAGHLEGVDYFAGAHVSVPFTEEEEDLVPGSYGALATYKYKVIFHGLSAHAGRTPQEGKNAVLAAAHAAVGLSGIARHSDGMSRINVGSIHGGSGSNVVPDEAVLTMEVRGETTQINEYMSQRAIQICQGAAMMEGCTCEMKKMGQAPSQKSDIEMTEKIAEICERYFPQYKVSSCHQGKNRDSEDVGFMMNRVQEQGGQAVYMRLVTKMASPQHTVLFDVDESVLKKGVKIFSAIAAELLK